MTGTRAALFSFLRVLAVALASAVLPFVTAPHSDEVPVRAVVYALIGAFLLTLINYFRPGDPRFGPEPKVHGEEGFTLVDVLILALIVLVLIVILGLLGFAPD